MNLTNDTFIIDEDAWENSKNKLIQDFNSSPNLEACLNLISDFEITNDKKYRSDLETFIRESNIDDFFNSTLETITVSTIHKAKGREFDNVYIMLNQPNFGSDENIRKVYVAMTRAKKSLSIHYNGNYLDFIKVQNLECIQDDNTYPLPNQYVLQLSMKDIWLDYSINRQNLITPLRCGDELVATTEGCNNQKGQVVMRFSNKIKEFISTKAQEGFMPTNAKIRYIVYWTKEGAENEVRVVLPEVCLEKNVPT